MGSLTRTVAPTVEPVTPAEVACQARIDATTELGLTHGYALAAREWAEDHMDRSLLPQTWQQTLDWGFPSEILLRRGPLLPGGTLVVSYVDADGATQTLSTSIYQVDRDSDPPRIRQAWGEVWPTVRDQMAAVTVTYQGGYGAASGAVPQSIRNAIVMLAAYWYDQRLPVTSSQTAVA